MSLELFKQCSPKCRKYQRKRCQWSRSKCAIAVVSFAFGHLWNQFSKGVCLENIFSRTTEMATMNNSPSLFYLTITKSSNLIMNKKWFHWNSCLHFSFDEVFPSFSDYCLRYVLLFSISVYCVLFFWFFSRFFSISVVFFSDFTWTSYWAFFWRFWYFQKKNETK